MHDTEIKSMYGRINVKKSSSHHIAARYSNSAGDSS